VVVIYRGDEKPNGCMYDLKRYSETFSDRYIEVSEREYLQQELDNGKLVKGGYYTVKKSGVIFKDDGTEKSEYYLGISSHSKSVDQFKRDSGAFSFDDKTELRISTTDEIQWLEDCNRANKFINKEEFMENKKVSYYTLTKINYAEAAIKIMETSFPAGSYKVSSENCIEKLKNAGVLDLWFKTVYVTEFRVGDWIMFDGYHKAGPYKLQIVDGANSRDIDGYTRDLPCSSYRLATAEEIKMVTSMFKTGDYVKRSGLYSTVSLTKEGILEEKNIMFLEKHL